MAKTNIIPPTLSDNNIRSFWKHVDKETPYGPWGSCWRWTGATNNKKYGTFGVRHNKINRYMTPHRVSYFLATKEWVLLVKHSCDIKDCVNPLHLSEGTHSQNTQEAVERGRIPCGERNYRAKITDSQAREIIAMAGTMTQRAIAKIYNLHYVTIHNIIRPKKWRHIV